MSVVTLQVGSKVFVREAIVGEPGVIVCLHGEAALVQWSDLPAGDTVSVHPLGELVPDESFLPGWPDASANAA